MHMHMRMPVCMCACRLPLHARRRSSSGTPASRLYYGDTYFGSTYYGSVFIGHADIEAQSEVMQGWVVGTLDAIAEEGIAHATLSRIITAETDERRFNLVDLALFLNMKRVLSQRYVQVRARSSVLILPE